MKWKIFFLFALVGLIFLTIAQTFSQYAWWWPFVIGLIFGSCSGWVAFKAGKK